MKSFNASSTLKKISNFLIMDKTIFYFLANQYLPFFSKQRSIMERYLHCKKWQKTSLIPLEIVIPCIERDVIILGLLAGSIRKFLLHPVRTIFQFDLPSFLKY